MLLGTLRQAVRSGAPVTALLLALPLIAQSPQLSVRPHPAPDTPDLHQALALAAFLTVTILCRKR
jgi:hypothetical protein